MAVASHDTDTSAARVARDVSAGHKTKRPGWPKATVTVLVKFWTKMGNDAIFNLSGLLAYNFLMSVFPILLVLLAIGGFLLENIAPAEKATLITRITAIFPAGTGEDIMVNVTNNLEKSAGILFIVGVALAIFTGSGLFVTLEWCMGIVFRLRGRDIIRQRLMSIGMLLLYAVLIPIVLLASIIPPILISMLSVGENSPLTGFVIQAAGDVFSVVVALLLFGAMYVVVPNRRVLWAEVWKGTIVATLLLVLYELLFPLYVGMFLKPQNYGATVGFALVILIFFYYLAFIVILGAEINSWAAGQRETAGDIAAILHEVQAHNTTRGAAGPTAGLPQEDMAHHKGAAAMSTMEDAIEHMRTDHRGSAQPPKFAESGVNPPGYNIQPREAREASYAETQGRYGDEALWKGELADTVEKAKVVARDMAVEQSLQGGGSGGEGERTIPGGGGTSISAAHAGEAREQQRPGRPLTDRQKQALWAVIAAGTVAVVPMLRLLPDLLRDDKGA